MATERIKYDGSAASVDKVMDVVGTSGVKLAKVLDIVNFYLPAPNPLMMGAN